MSYLYETHLHTAQGSRCAKTPGREHARFYKDLGFQGIIVTDHFFGGNTCAPRTGPWKERIDVFCSGYEDALSEGQKIGLDVFFGWEQCYGDDEYLVYGLDKQWLINHPEVEHWTRREQLETVHRHGGCVIQAHPFRTCHYIQHVRLGKRFCDGVEVANVGNGAANDACAYRYAKYCSLPMTAGSDNHHSFPELDVGSKIMGVALDRRIASLQDFAQIVRNRKPIGLNVDPARFAVTPDMAPIEAFWLDENEDIVPTNRNWLCE